MESSSPLVLLISATPERRRIIHELLITADPSFTLVEDVWGDELRQGWPVPPPDCVLLDAEQPGHDCLAILSELRSSGDAPVVLLIGPGGEAIAAAALARGAQDYLSVETLTSLRLRSTIGHAIAAARLARTHAKVVAMLDTAATQAHARLEALINSATTGIAYLDRELRYVLVNPYLAALNDLSPEAHIGRTLDEVIPRVSTYLAPLVREVFATGKPAPDLELHGLQNPKDGVARQWLISTFPVADLEGGVAGIGLMLADLTQRKCIEAALHASEARFRLLYETINQGVIYHDAMGRIVALNPAAERIVGYSANQLLGRSVLPATVGAVDEAGAPFDPENHPALVALRTGHEVRDVVIGFYEASRDERRWLRIHAVPQFQPGEDRPSQVYTIFDDITEARRFVRTLEYQRQQLAAIVGTLSEGVIAFHPDATIALINDAALSLGGLEHMTASVGLNLSALLDAAGMRLCDTNGRELSEDEWPQLRVLRGERFKDLEVRVQPSDSEQQRWFAISGAPVNGPDGRLTLAVLTVREITLRKRDAAALQAHAEALSKTNAELARALRLKDEFLAMMSHELRTPLNSVLGYAESIEEGLYGPVNEQQRQALGRVGQSGRHLLAILSDILDLTHIEGGAVQLEPQLTNLEALCRATLQLVRPAAQKKQIRLVYNRQQGVESLRADERRLAQILLNLLDNAVKFTPAGGAVGLEIQADREHEQLRLIVWDTGIGIPTTEFGRLFQPFTQVDGRLARQYEGIGLGLLLVRRLSELHGGSVSLESTVGEGSRFTVSLPWSVADNLTSLESGQAPAQAATMLSVARVLLVDDHEASLDLYRDLLSQEGYEVTVARSGEEALMLMREQPPDAALVDIQMPTMDGLTLMRLMRADPLLAAVPILALTALAMPGDRERCLAAGANAYLAKPISMRLLLSTLAAALAEIRPLT